MSGQANQKAATVTPRRKKGQPVEEKPKPKHSLVRDEIAFVLVASALFLGCALWSYISWGGVPGEPAPIKNVMGPLGGALAETFMALFGYASFVVVGILLLLAHSTYKGPGEGEQKSFQSRATSVCLAFSAIVLSVTTFAAAYWGHAGGGIVGAKIAYRLTGLVDVGGTALLMFTLLVVSIGALTGKGPRLAFQALEYATRQGTKAAKGATVVAGGFLGWLLFRCTLMWKLLLVVVILALEFIRDVFTWTVGLPFRMCQYAFEGFVSVFHGISERRAKRTTASVPPPPVSTERVTEPDDLDDDDESGLVELETIVPDSDAKNGDGGIWRFGVQELDQQLFSRGVEPATPSGESLPPPPPTFVVSEPEEPDQDTEDEEDEEAERPLSRLRKAAKLRRRRVRMKKADSKPEPAAQPEEEEDKSTLPPLDLLAPVERNGKSPVVKEELVRNAKRLEQVLSDFRITGRITEAQPGPVITLYQFEPAPGVKVQRVIGLADDLALSLKVASVRVYAPVPGKGTVGIEVPNSERQLVRLREILESDEYQRAKSPLVLGLGKNTAGEPFAADLHSMPHLLIAGATGTGKSVCLNSVLVSLLYRNTPEQLKLIMIDPKMLELSVYEDIPHLLSHVVTNPRRARGVLQWAVEEMDRRYHLLKKAGVRDLGGYNASCDAMKLTGNIERIPVEGEEDLSRTIVRPLPLKLPRIVIVVDELADLMLTVGREIEDLLARLAQKARASGIHLVLATQRPSVDVITGLIKANFPSRISFKVASRIDSRTVLDGSGAEKLLGQGDMLFLSPGAHGVRRLHGAFLSDQEVHEVVRYIRQQGAPQYDPAIEEKMARSEEEARGEGSGGFGEEEFDPLYDQAVSLVIEKGQASTSMIQRVFRIGYNRAARIVETMEREGVIGPGDGAKPRPIMMQRSE